MKDFVLEDLVKTYLEWRVKYPSGSLKEFFEYMNIEELNTVCRVAVAGREVLILERS